MSGFETGHNGQVNPAPGGYDYALNSWASVSPNTCRDLDDPEGHWTIAFIAGVLRGSGGYSAEQALSTARSARAAAAVIHQPQLKIGG